MTFPQANINPEFLIWARKTAGYSAEEAASKIKVKTYRLNSWESGEAKPTWNQLRKISRVYKRPSALFFRSEVPEEEEMVTDFRTLPNSDLKHSPQLIFALREAYERREIVLDLVEELEWEIPVFDLEGSIVDDPKDLARRIREYLGVTLEEQYSWKTDYDALRSWRETLETRGVLIFSVTQIELSQMRGYSINKHPFPIVGVNNKDTPRGRIFTIFHELTHVIVGKEGICDSDLFEEESKTESFCNKVAGEVLVPEEALLGENLVKSNKSPFWEEPALNALANKFNVSKGVILTRLLWLNRTTREFYNGKMREYARRVHKDTEGGPPYHRKLLSWNGRYFTDVVLSAYHEGIINSHDASNFFGGAKLEHMDELEGELV